uniref:Uncharacterized protein n=1 Tax=Nelumbo nucifera TaxID=4432 RepID=A0A822YHQ5_NELNU|nr:TPA_asm: hypothetical protein HUJ06_010898 [Nelumbo nucifera]
MQETLTTEPIESHALPLESIDDVHGSDSLSTSVLCVGDGITNDVFEEDPTFFFLISSCDSAVFDFYALLFVPSGEGLGVKYAKASSVEPKSAGLIDQLTMNVGAFRGSRYAFSLFLGCSFLGGEAEVSVTGSNPPPLQYFWVLFSC